MNKESSNSSQNYPIIEIQVSCKDLIKSNSICYFYIKENIHYNESDHSEVIYNNSNPTYIKTFYVYYIFDSHQPIRFEFYYKKFDKEQLQNENFLGSYETDVYHLVSNNEQTIQANLNQGEHNYQNYHSQIILNFRQFKENNEFLQGQIHVRNLRKMKTFSKNNPYIEISRSCSNGKNDFLIPVYRSEVKSKCYSCTFKPFLIPLNSICPNGNLHQMVVVTCFDYSDRKPPKEIFHCLNSVNEFMKPSHFRSISEKNMNFSSLKIVKIPTFSDYLKNGVKLNVITAIDFTNSNNSHRFLSNKPNEFQDCILSIGSILSKYMVDSKFTVIGFGGQINGQSGDCFKIGNEKKWLNSVDEISTAYKETSNIIKRSKQANFSPVIREAQSIAVSEASDLRVYSILLILTEGNIGDMKETIEAINEATKSPLSIIIVGIGSGDFSKMEFLDADNEYLKTKNGDFIYDIVQFINFNRYKKSGACTIERQILAEIPSQIHHYYVLNGFVINVEDKKK